MTKAEIDRQKYIICCPMCDSKKCVRGTDRCEAEQWAKEMEVEHEHNSQK